MIRVRFLLSIQMTCLCFGIEQVSPPWGFTFSQWAGDPLDVIVYIPAGAHKNTKILMVVPGASRDTQRFHASWLSFAKEDTFAVVTIGANKKYFPDEYSYNAGNAITPNGKSVDNSLWLFTAIEKVFQSVKSRYGFEVKKFYLFGHSAGGGLCIVICSLCRMRLLKKPFRQTLHL